MRKGTNVGLAVLALALVAATAAFPASNRSQAKDTFIVGAEGDPILLDGSLVSDGTSLRVIAQIFEGLVRNKPGTLAIEPALATSYKASKNGLAWTFNLRQGVKFTDGTAFNSAAVCANFTRWWFRPSELQGDDISYYWNTVFGGYAKPAPGGNGPDKALYKGCKTAGPNKVKILLTRRSSSFLGALALANFGIASPTALKKYKADEGTVGADGQFRPSGTFATQNPIGTGPLKLQSWKVGDKLVLVRNAQYWGPKAKTKTVIVRPISDTTARVQALQTGEVDFANNLTPQDAAVVKSNSNLKVQYRPAFNVGYVGINQKIGPLAKLKVRQALAYGLDRKSVVGAFYGGQGQVADQFLPPLVEGFAKKGVPQYTYNPTKAKQLLQEAGEKLPVELEFWYPTDRPRGYMPDPPRNFQAFAASLEKSGFKITPKPGQWRGGYVSGVQGGKAALFLFGWTGDFGDPANFLNVHFGSYTDQFGFNDKKLFDLLTQADQETDIDKRTGLYQAASVYVMQRLPMVPYVHTTVAVGLRKNVTGYKMSPVELESFASVVVG
jgi:peptide/nickel transport system substrate-binding protein